MAGISSKALNTGGNDPSCGCPNKIGFNGNEIQNKEFGDRSGLDVYDFNARTYDPQIGRFIQIDPLIEFGEQEGMSPYQFSYNNPVRYNDPDGNCPMCLVWGIIEIVSALSVETVATATVIAATATVTVAAVADASANASTSPIAASGTLEGRQAGSPLLMGTGGSAPFSNQSYTTQSSARVSDAGGKASESSNKTFNGQHDTQSKTPKEALRIAKEENGIPRSQQPDKTIKPNTPEGDKAGLDSRNVKQYEYTNSQGKKVIIRQDKAANYPDGGTQPPHFNAGQGPAKLDQHHNYPPWRGSLGF